jgi:hypothetical protein
MVGNVTFVPKYASVLGTVKQANLHTWLQHDLIWVHFAHALRINLDREFRNLWVVCGVWGLRVTNAIA